MFNFPLGTKGKLMVLGVCFYMYSKILLLRPPKIKTTSLLCPAFASPKWYFPYDIIFNFKITSLIRPLSGSPKGGLKIGISCIWLAILTL